MPEAVDGMKTCSTCGETKAVTEFHTQIDKPQGVRASCKECRKKYRDDPDVKERRAVWAKEYYSRPDVKKRRKEYNRSPEVRKRNRGSALRMRQRNPHYYWAIGTTNHHKKRGYDVVVSIQELEVLGKNTTHCYYCGVKLEWGAGKGLHPSKPSLDRINNENEIRSDNIIIICHQCNRSKGERTHEEFVAYCKLIVERAEFPLRWAYG